MWKRRGPSQFLRVSSVCLQTHRLVFVVIVSLCSCTQGWFALWSQKCAHQEQEVEVVLCVLVSLMSACLFGTSVTVCRCCCETLLQFSNTGMLSVGRLERCLPSLWYHGTRWTFTSLPRLGTLSFSQLKRFTPSPFQVNKSNICWLQFVLKEDAMLFFELSDRKRPSFWSQRKKGGCRFAVRGIFFYTWETKWWSINGENCCQMNRWRLLVAVLRCTCSPMTGVKGTQSADWRTFWIVFQHF